MVALEGKPRISPYRLRPSHALTDTPKCRLFGNSLRFSGCISNR